MDTKSTSSATRPPVLVSGAGPTGLLMSLWLTRFGVPHRIVDKNSGPGLTSRAIVVHARTLELYRSLGIADDLIGLGARVEGACVTHAGKEQGFIRVGNAGVGQSHYPFVLSVTQDEHEELLERKLSEVGQKVERGLEIAGLEAPGAGADGDVSVKIRSVESGKEETMTASYVLGCDGAHSGVRHATGIKMEGGTYGRTFFVADVYYSGSLPKPGQLHLCFTKQGFLVLLPLPHKTNRARIIGFVPPEKEEMGTKVTFEDCRPAVTDAMPAITVDEVRWFASYKVHHRTADHFQYGPRVFLSGDASHLHSPVGGQGMNTGLGDASNLAWKIATAWHAGAADPTVGQRLLATYEQERQPFAHQLVSTTDNMFQLVIQNTWSGWMVRNVVFPYIVPFLTHFSSFTAMFFRTVSQVAIEYAKSPASEALGGAALAGYRLPWVEHAGGAAGDGDGDGDNHAVLDGKGWQAHVWGSNLPATLEQALWRAKVAVKKFPFTPAAASKGFVENTVYLVRPDGYIGLVLPHASSPAGEKEAQAALEAYAEKWCVRKLPAK